MPRENRIEFENSFHHVFNRGYNQMDIFFDEEDFDFFINQILRVNISHGIIIHSYCLMNNHFHLLLQNPLINLSTAMQLILTRYASYFKRKYNHRGKVFEKRFSSILIDAELYLIRLAKYIHHNPVGVIVDNLEDWAWSSYRYYIDSSLLKPRFLETDLILQKHKNLEAFVKYENEHGHWNPHEYIFSGVILGSDKFIEEITLQHVAPTIDTDLKGSFQLNKTYRNRISQIKDLIAKKNFDLPNQISLIIYALREKTNLTYQEISQKLFLGSFSPSAISGMYSRLKSRAQTDFSLAKALIEIKSL